jgi:hypothetical protein
MKTSYHPLKMVAIHEKAISFCPNHQDQAHCLSCDIEESLAISLLELEGEPLYEKHIL